MRYWSNRQADDGSIHCLGNGRMAAYEQGPNIIQVFGPPYSSPSFMQVAVTGSQNIEAQSERMFGTAIWIHKIFRDGKPIGEFTDFIDVNFACLVRKFNLVEDIDLELKVQDGIHIVNHTDRFKEFGTNACFLMSSEAGTYIYWKYPSPGQICHHVAVKGSVQAHQAGGKQEFIVKCTAGEGYLYISGGPSYIECVKNMENTLHTDYNTLFTRTHKYWMDFTNRRLSFETIIPHHVPQREKLLQTIDDVAVLIKVQQGMEGGVLAGSNYHLGYVRDQYGVSRGLLKLGYFEEAKAILNFYWNIWKRYGKIHNAQAMGVDGVFHIHENDDVEITGYLIIQAFNYYDHTGDEAFLNEILPMLEWAWEAQKKHLTDGMLPFNGDETYVAGGILPRTTLNDGSAEATLLFVTGGEKLLEWVDKNKVWTETRMNESLDILDKTRQQYRKNFWKEGRLAANNSQRAARELPKYRHGVCQQCGSFEPWTELGATGFYVCPSCLSKPQMPAVEPQTFYLQSVSLTPFYIGATLLTRDEIKQLVDDIVQKYKATGRLPSRPDGNSSVGYDYGFLLYTLTELGDPLAEDIYGRMLSIVDPTGAWVEYYMEDKPYNTRYRPWESGINLEAALHYILKDR